MIIGVTGPRGRLGSELVRQGCAPIEANINSYKLGQVVKAARPDIIIHCAAFTDVDLAESNPNQASRTNAGGTFNLAQVFNGKIIYISTDYVFDGQNGPYLEDDKPNPISIYGWSKLGGEIAIKNRDNKDDLIIRTTVLFDKNKGNFVTSVINKLGDNQDIEAPDYLYGSPTYVPHLAKSILASINQVGILNLAGNTIMSRYDLARWVAARMSKEGYVKGGSVTGKAPRPFRAGLLIGKAKRLGLPLINPFEGIDEILREVN